MLKVNECADVWKNIVKLYNKTKDKSPVVTIEQILERFGKETTEEVFATVAAIKAGDGRIYGKNREYMNSITINPDAVVMSECNNPMMYCGLDDIHSAHIDQMITELRSICQFLK
ncbi:MULTISPECIES: hypothetical protein [Clostridia]|uniref:hypothetical protein n=1 Tax=Clostridia TaxID=186801 RepID=UPI000E4693F6|nr:MULTISPECIES: hypothetical protein [Clostridia]RHV70238.1 hypothetical protein DXB15_08025 [Roseburia sp. OM02-15]